jgi:TetR/AcrR family transcriptional regulator, cholesterol catabolism regulator
MGNRANNIVEKAEILFMQNGLHSVSMDDIASYTGISKKTLYGNFQSKELLVNTIVQKLISKTSKYIRLCPDISPNAVKEIENFSEHILGVLEILTRKFIRDLKRYYPETYTLLTVFRDNSIIPYIERCLRRGITEEIFRNDINIRETGWLYCWQIQNVLEGDTSHAEVSEVIENANDLFLHGISNSKGLKLLGLNKQKENTGQKEKLRTS